MIIPIGQYISVLAYMASRKAGPGPLYRFEDGWQLTRPLLVKEISSALKRVGVSSASITGHNLRIRAATKTVSSGVEDSVIIEKGQWKSNAFQ